MTKSSGTDSKNARYCSFCGKSQHEVRKLIAGPTVFICDECVELCMDITEHETTLVKSEDELSRTLKNSEFAKQNVGSSNVTLA